MKGKKVMLGVVSIVLVAAILVFCFVNNANSKIMSEGTLVSVGTQI